MRPKNHDAATKSARLIALFMATRAAEIDPATVNTVALAERLGIHRATAWRDIQELAEMATEVDRILALIQSEPIPHEKQPQ